MARTTLLFGAALTLLGVAFFIATGHAYPTSLIPCVLGVILLLCGTLANTDVPRTRMLWMHIAVTVGLLGFLAALGRAVPTYIKSQGAPLAHPAAVYEQIAMAVLCFIFVVLCVRSFIAARRQRTQ